MNLEENIETSADDSPALKTQFKNPPTIAELESDYNSAESFQSVHVAKLNSWLDNLYCTGSAAIKKRKGRSGVQPKLILKLLEWRCPALSEPFLSSKKLFDVKPVSWEDRESARQNELLLNNQFNTKINKRHFIDSLVRKAASEGTCIIRTGWNTKTELVKKVVPVYDYYPILEEDEEAHSILQQAIELKQANPAEFKQLESEWQESANKTLEMETPIKAVIIDYETVEEEELVENHPTVTICNTENVVIDPSCQGDMDKARFVFYKYETSIDELKKTGSFEDIEALITKKESDELFADLSDTEIKSSTPQDFNLTGKTRKRFVVTEFWGEWDVNGDGILVPIVATYIKGKLLRVTESPFPDGKPPFVVIPYIPIAGSFYGMPDGELVEDNQNIIGATTRAMIDLIARSANGQTATRKGSLDYVNKRKFDNGEDFEIDAQNYPVSEAIQMMKAPEIPSAIPLLISHQNNEAESLSGVKAFSAGIDSASLGDVATGIRGVLDASSKRELSILRRITDGIVAVGRKIIAMNAEFLADEEIIRVTNDSFIAISRDKLAGDFDLEVDISTAEMDAQKAQELAFMVQTMGESVPFDMKALMLSEIARLRKMPDLAHAIQNYQPEPDPFDQEMQQLELELKRNQIAESQAKAAYYQQRAALAGSQSNKTALDYEEQARGITHARGMAKIAEQSKSQLATKLVSSAYDNGRNQFKPSNQ